MREHRKTAFNSWGETFPKSNLAVPPTYISHRGVSGGGRSNFFGTIANASKKLAKHTIASNERPVDSASER